ncbi:pentatricopeptide repeat-containing protein At2g42920, chloroplastic-like [Phragmites australis]|uniref:pentatricopeptide repeat-containing protein At2g42920, chloroplastic-like n=1 Tax=Phragmites australis TaxID=29695 RepID=UPI002D774CD9|nr:pentatricopeptide repeat-containing protein At2g42920, chloroplastic-like [Phragmites australis]
MAMAPLHARACCSPTPTPTPSTAPLLPSSASISAFIASHPALTLLHTRCASMAHLRQLHAALVKSGLARDPIAASRAVAFCAGPGRNVTYAERIVRHHPRPNSFMWNTVIKALSDGAGPEAAVALFVDMLGSPMLPERRTFPSLFAAYARLGRASDGAALHGMALKLGLAGDAYVRNATIAMYASCGRANEALALFGQCPEFDVVACNSVIVALARAGRVDEARAVFDGMPERTVVTWSAMVSTYARAARCKDAMALFAAMQADGVEPNANVLVSVLGCCANLGALEQGAWVHAYIGTHRVAMNALVVTALVDMYCKCGSIHKARQVFDTARSQGLAKLSSWNSMMQGLAVHGQCQEAVALFSELNSYGLSPDNVTFIAVLTAYGHSGMPEEAKAAFASMASEHGVVPEIEHYGCIVDALARAGRLREAEDAIWSMPMAPDAAVWGALLSGCRLHGDAELGARAAREAVRCDPRDSGAYVLAASVLERGGEAGCGAGVRGRMRQAGVAKVPGCSMIEVNGVVHEFVS